MLRVRIRVRVRVISSAAAHPFGRCLAIVLSPSLFKPYPNPPSAATPRHNFWQQNFAGVCEVCFFDLVKLISLVCLFRSERILLLFDAHKLDISDELKEVTSNITHTHTHTHTHMQPKKLNGRREWTGRTDESGQNEQTGETNTTTAGKQRLGGGGWKGGMNVTFAVVLIFTVTSSGDSRSSRE
tara:strand:- start:1007 stop:1558 length:552 start_codon:yes stop_codon:yes gene_type:complete